MTANIFHFPCEFYKKYNEKLEVLNRFALDQHYLRTFIDLSSRPASDSDNVTQTQSKFYSYFKNKLRQLSRVPSAELLTTYHTNLDLCERFIEQDRATFLRDIDEIIKNSYHLRYIVRILNQIDIIVERYSEQLVNIQNLRISVQKSEIRPHLTSHYDRVLSLIDFHYPIAKKMDDQDATSQESSISIEGFEELLNDAVQKKKQSMQIASEEIQELNRTLFRSEISLTSRNRLGTQSIQNKVHTVKTQMKSINDIETEICRMQEEMAEIAKNTALAREDLSKTKREMSDALEDLVRLHHLLDLINQEILKQVKDYNDQINALQRERDRIMNNPNLSQEEKAAKLKQLDDKIAVLTGKQEEALGQLNIHKSDINMEIQRRLQEQSDELERSKIGKTQSEIERIDEQIKALQDAFDPEKVAASRELEELEQSKVGKTPSECERMDKQFQEMEELKKSKLGKSPSECARIDAQLEQMKEIEELERSKIGKTPSEIERIDAARQKIQNQMQEDKVNNEILNMMQSKVGKTPSEIERIDAKIRALRNSICPEALAITAEMEKLAKSKIGKTPSEIAEIDRQIAELQNNLQNTLNQDKVVKNDDIGTYYYNENGEKVYMHKFLVDEDGRKYYVLEDGTIVYAETEIASSSSHEDSFACTGRPEMAQVYIENAKKYLGRALRLALADTILHQPTDPINFIANHLVKQRHAELSKAVELIRNEATLDARERARKCAKNKKMNKLDLCDPCAKYKE